MTMTRHYEPMTATHADAFHALCSDEHVRRYLLDGAVLPLAWAEAEIERSLALFDEHGVGLWLVQEAGVTVGFCGFRVFESMGPAPQLLYAFPERFTGRGRATAACQFMLERTAELGWTRVEAAVDAPNRASIRVLDKCGFAVSGHVPGEFGDTLLFTRPHQDVPKRSVALTIACTWDGEALDEHERVDIALDVQDHESILKIDAPYHGDPAPTGDVGSTEQLWDHEVVELMLLGADDHYLEIELGPHGHYLLLLLEGRRNVVHQGMTMYYDAQIRADRWSGRARIPHSWLPRGWDRLNAYAMYGVGTKRRHLAWQPRRGATAGDRPDFHTLSTFARL